MGGISIYRLDESDALIADSAHTAPAGASVNSVVIHPAGLFAYAVHDTGDIAVYNVNLSDGTLSPTSDVIQVQDAGDLLFHPSGRFAYVVANQGLGTDSVRFYGVNEQTGALSFLEATSFDDRVRIAIDPQGRVLYMSESEGTVSSYDIADTGALSFRNSVPAAPFGGASVIAPSGAFLYMAHGGQISMHPISPAGDLGASNIVSPDNAARIAIDPLGRFLYALMDGTTALSAYRIDANGTLTSAGTMSIGDAGNAVSIAISPAGRFVYVAQSTENVVLGFGIDQTTGEMIGPPHVVPTGVGPTSSISFMTVLT